MKAAYRKDRLFVSRKKALHDRNLPKLQTPNSELQTPSSHYFTPVERYFPITGNFSNSFLSTFDIKMRNPAIINVAVK